MNEWITPAVIVALIGGLGAVLNYRINRVSTLSTAASADATAAQTLADAAKSLIAPYVSRLAEAERERHADRERIQHLEERCRDFEEMMTDRNNLKGRLEWTDREVKRLRDHVAALEKQNAQQSTRIAELEHHLRLNGLEFP